jgi:hypothetical protein
VDQMPKGNLLFCAFVPSFSCIVSLLQHNHHKDLVSHFECHICIYNIGHQIILINYNRQIIKINKLLQLNCIYDIFLLSVSVKSFTLTMYRK